MFSNGDAFGSCDFQYGDVRYRCFNITQYYTDIFAFYNTSTAQSYATHRMSLMSVCIAHMERIHTEAVRHCHCIVDSYFIQKLAQLCVQYKTAEI